MTYPYRERLTREDLEHAAASQTPIEGRFFQYLNLRDANLDGLILTRCDLSGSDLRGVNLSGARLTGCTLRDVDLVDSCLAESDFTFCDFSHARWGASILTDSHFSGCRFAGLSALRLDWWEAKALESLTYRDEDQDIPFNEAPLILTGPHGIRCKIGHAWIRNPVNDKQDDTTPDQPFQSRSERIPPDGKVKKPAG